MNCPRGYLGEVLSRQEKSPVQMHQRRNESVDQEKRGGSSGQSREELRWGLMSGSRRPRWHYKDFVFSLSKSWSYQIVLNRRQIWYDFSLEAVVSSLATAQNGQVKVEWPAEETVRCSVQAGDIGCLSGMWAGKITEGDWTLDIFKDGLYSISWWIKSEKKESRRTLKASDNMSRNIGGLLWQWGHHRHLI